ncbi:coiled-coil domain-containing protein 7-like isoform X10 [Panthera leo]|uniref:coiled-coil domain-containing protein 7-like isoform X10 n=2 Tax=Pantherinae TaxID=338153 RepID=UPI001C697367|nr:coiled-coil domain-containing protein 7-like isoform X10 [Panthera leo]
MLDENQDSISKTQMQVKKQRTSKGERNINNDDVPDKNLMLKHQDSKSETEMQVKKQKTSQGEAFITHDNITDENPVLEPQESMSKTQLQVNKQKIAKEERVTTHDKVPGNHDPKDSMSKTQLQVKKQRASKGERFYALNEVLDENLKLKHQDSVSKTQVQFKKQKKSTEERISNVDPSLNKCHLNMTSLPSHLLIAHFGVPDENLMLMNEDSVSQPQMQVEKQITYRKKRCHTYFGIPDENLMFASQDSASKSQVQVKKKITSRKERRKTEKMDEKAGKNLSPEDNEVLISKGSSQIKTLGATRKVGLTIKNEVASELPDMADIPAINPSISDLILQLDLNKVIETDIEHLKDAIERSILVKEKKIQSKSLPGVNLFKNRYMSTQHQEDFFNSHIAPRKFSTNRISFSTFDTQERSEYISPHVNKPPKAYHRTSRAGSTIYKTIQFPSLNKEPSGHPKNCISNKKEC